MTIETCIMLFLLSAAAFATYRHGYLTGSAAEKACNEGRLAACRQGRHVWKYVHFSAKADGSTLADYRCINCGDWEQRLNA